MPYCYTLTDELEGQIEIHQHRAEVTLAVWDIDARDYCHHTVDIGHWTNYSELLAALKQLVLDVLPEGDINLGEALTACDVLIESALATEDEDWEDDE